MGQEFRKIIRMLAKKKGFKVVDVLRKIGKSKTSYYQMHNPPYNTLMGFVKELDCSIHEFLPIKEGLYKKDGNTTHP